MSPYELTGWLIAACAIAPLFVAGLVKRRQMIKEMYGERDPYRDLAKSIYTERSQVAKGPHGIHRHHRNPKGD